MRYRGLINSSALVGPSLTKRYWCGIEQYQCDTVYKCMKLSETSACCTEPLALVCFNGSLSDSVVEDV